MEVAPSSYSPRRQTPPSLWIRPSWFRRARLGWHRGSGYQVDKDDSACFVGGGFHIQDDQEDGAVNHGILMFDPAEVDPVSEAAAKQVADNMIASADKIEALVVVQQKNGDSSSEAETKEAIEDDDDVQSDLQRYDEDQVHNLRVLVLDASLHVISDVQPVFS